MADDIKLPPLPAWMEEYIIPEDDADAKRFPSRLAERMREYARAAIQAELNRQAAPAQEGVRGTIRVTYRGTPPSERLWQGHCDYCHSRAEATESALTNIQTDQREAERFSFEKCPVCGNDGASGYGGMMFHPVDSRGRK